ncbi:Hypothetical protein POVR2_LOCUS119 [uncultured virus]|nr:Hypothetical protein POVR2_LOCUS119 [uncultured virus]
MNPGDARVEAGLRAMMAAPISRLVTDRVVPDLPQFFESYLTDVPLPQELQNYPFTLKDTGDRIEMRVSRPKFMFSISDRLCTCVIGTEIIGTAHDHTLQWPKGSKRQSDASVLTIYDTYGLEVACTYLRYLYNTKYLFDAPAWLLVYLLGSLEAITPSDVGYDTSSTSKYHILYLCCQIMRALENLDKNEPKMLEQLEEVPEDTLPADLLARIIGSQRVSKSVAEEVLHQKCSSVPTNQELKEANGWTSLNGLILRSADMKEYVIGTERYLGREKLIEQRKIVRSGGKFIYTYAYSDSFLNLPDQQVVGFQLYDYERAYQARGCPEGSILSMLRGIRRNVKPIEEDVEAICCWILALDAHLGLNEEDDNEDEAIFSNIYELAAKLDDLIEEFINSEQ